MIKMIHCKFEVVNNVYCTIVVSALCVFSSLLHALCMYVFNSLLHTERLVWKMLSLYVVVKAYITTA